MNKSEEVISILVVDDDTTCLSVISAILRKWNYEVVTVKHPVDALCTLRIKGGAFHLVVTDVHMPDMNGFELQQAIAQEFKLPVGLMSADDKEDIESKGMENGAAFFLMKPIRSDNLRDLWQFADKKRQNQVVIEETYKSSDVITVSGSSVNEDKHSKQEYSRKKSSIKEGNEKGEGNSEAKSKKVKVNWTISLHNNFLEALRIIGLERAVPKRILEVMNVPGLTRENVASHLQKYRIFLKRVSDASYKIQHSADQNLVSKTLLGSQLSSRNHSVPTISKFSRNQNPRQSFQRSFGEHVPSGNATFASQETSSSYLKTQSPTHFKGRSLLMSNEIGGSNYQANPSLKGSLWSHQTAAPQDLTNGLSSFGDSTLGVGGLSNNEIPAYQHIGTSNISSASTNLRPVSNYVGYRISDIGLIAESAAHKERGQGSDLLDKFTNFTGKSHCKNSGNSGLLEGDISWSSIFDEIQDTSAFLPSDPPMLDGIENGENDSVFFQIYDLQDMDILSTQQSLDGGTASNQVIIQSSQPKQNVGENVMNSNFSDGMYQWQASPPVPRFDQTPSQNQGRGTHLIDSQQSGTSTEPSNTFLSPNEQNGGGNVLNFNISGGMNQWQGSPPVPSFEQTPSQHQSGGINLISQQCGTSTEPSNTFLSSDERDDVEYLESLLAFGPFGEDDHEEIFKLN